MHNPSQYHPGSIRGTWPKKPPAQTAGSTERQWHCRGSLHRGQSEQGPEGAATTLGDAAHRAELQRQLRDCGAALHSPTEPGTDPKIR